MGTRGTTILHDYIMFLYVLCMRLHDFILFVYVFNMILHDLMMLTIMLIVMTYDAYYYAYCNDI